ncbi:deaminase domain-containing protein [Clostridium sp. ATCC 25772]|uniref:deaminase domain-containing protein n=1 Tax=Clostridium sp. ATCC 25772 TaxID=1676991 RepID=UPI0007865305|nr:deaminase domain-containing protein [Clostridium sp. ATCC 25772]
MISKRIKKQRIDINNLNDFKDALKKEGYKINEFDEEKFKVEIAKTFEVDNSLIESLYTYISEDEITYRANDIKDLIDYINKMVLFENQHNKLCKKISTIKKISIDRIEYEKEPSIQDNIGNMINIIEKVSNKISGLISEKEKIKLEKLEKELDKQYIYAKDIELLKKMILIRKGGVKEKYNAKTKIKTISIEIPERINYEYIKAKKGTIEYHEYLSNNIPRMKRLIKNINKYMKADEKEKTAFKINQSKTLQDSINIALATYDGKEFRAISGSNEIRNYCSAPPLEKAIFKSSKVNKLGKIGIGYDRVNDSEKKILEEIHKQIEEKVLKDEGNLTLYSKWEPCPSCYSVINQFMKKHPYIDVQVKYIKKYSKES